MPLFKIMLMLVAVLFAAGCKGNGPEAEKYAAEFISAVHEGRLEDAYGMGAMSLQKKYSLESFRALIEPHRAHFAADGPGEVMVTVPDRNEGFFPRTGMWRIAATMSEPDADHPTNMIFLLVEQETDAPAFWVVDVRFSEHIKPIPKHDRWSK